MFNGDWLSGELNKKSVVKSKDSYRRRAVDVAQDAPLPEDMDPDCQKADHPTLARAVHKHALVGAKTLSIEWN